jgi:hypothetical protein
MTYILIAVIISLVIAAWYWGKRQYKRGVEQEKRCWIAHSYSNSTLERDYGFYRVFRYKRNAYATKPRKAKVTP